MSRAGCAPTRNKMVLEEDQASILTEKGGNKRNMNILELQMSRIFAFKFHTE